MIIRSLLKVAWVLRGYTGEALVAIKLTKIIELTIVAHATNPLGSVMLGRRNLPNT